MSVESSSEADRGSLWPPASAPIAPAAVSRTLDEQVERRPLDTSNAYVAWNRDRLRGRLASRDEEWPLPPLVGGVNVFVLHPTRQVTPANTLFGALRRRGYVIYAPARPGGGASTIAQCHLLIVLIDEASATALAEGSLEIWMEVLAAARAVELPVLGVWFSGDALPAPFEAGAVLDLRGLADVDVDVAVGASFPERLVYVIGTRGDRTLRSVGPRGAGDLEGVRHAVEYLDDLGEFVSIQLVSGPTEVDPSDAPEVMGLERLLDPTRRRLAARNDPQLWPGLRDELRRAGDENAERGIEAWNRERLAARQAGRAGGARELPIVGAPRIFISYRWESLEHKAWVDRLSGDLFGRGYDVVFDRHPDEIDDPHGPDDIFFRIAACTIFLAVVTDAYVDAIEPAGEASQSWSAREWEEAIALHRQADTLGDPDDLRIVGVRPSGSRLPPDLEPDSVVDLSDGPDDFGRLDAPFPELDVSLGITIAGRRLAVGPVRRGDIDAVLTAMEPAIDAGAFVEAQLWRLGTSGESDPELAYAAGVSAFNSGNARRDAGDSAGARAAYRTAAALGVGKPSAMAVFNLAALDQSDGYHDEAVAGYRVALAAEDAEVRAAGGLALGRLLAEVGDEDEAVEAYAETIRSGHPDYARAASLEAPGAAVWLGFRLHDAGDLAGAEAAYELAAATHDPVHAGVAAYNLGTLRRERGDLPGARAAYAQAAAEDDEEAAQRAWFNLGQLLREGGDAEAAARAFSVAERGPDADVAARARAQL